MLLSNSGYMLYILDRIIDIIYFFLFFQQRNRKSKQTTLQSCLKSIKGEKVFPIDAEYTSDIIDANTRVTFKPAVIIYVANINDIQISVKCATKLQTGIIARSGGHSYEKYSTGGRDGVIVVDVTNLNGISINSKKKTAVIGAGNRLGPIYYNLSQKGFLIPAGSCPSIGIAGHALGGGYGFYGRKFGLASDNIISIDMINAEGNLTTANAKQNSDLFFALRGAGGGSYGIVTSITFKLSPIPEIVTSFIFDYNISNVQQVFDAVHKFGAKLTKDVTFAVVISSTEFQLLGTYLGNNQSARETMQDITTSTNPSAQFIEESFFESVVRWSYVSVDAVRDPFYNSSSFKAKSFFVKLPGLSKAGIQSITNFIQNQPCSSFAMFDLFGGGAVNSIAPNATAFVHRDELYGIQLYSTLTGQVDVCLNNLKSFGVEFQKNYTSQFSYQNYIDRDLVGWKHKYYGSNFRRLVNIKSKYDPENLFSFPQSIPVKEN
ncbi:hypothetical protein Glove_340g76 [Diversispora epigaea]|uniref:FAD-binding PCMH-type domain-containing protein n=1 Tax=Diversispora epigaea TaxID=1348612 RepID=A0A397HHI6_9GLOM|nr:hypothetical protein Glove_340g76 [Diversispora epigaea]